MKSYFLKLCYLEHVTKLVKSAITSNKYKLALKKKVKQSCYRPGVARRVPGS